MVVDYNKCLAAAIKELAAIDEKLKSPTKGKQKYTMVKDRVRIFRKHFGVDAQIDTTQVIEQYYVRSETTISIGGDRVANGIAEEDRRFGMVNKTSAAENAETSSIGRALANLGLQGGEYPSGDELLIAIEQQSKELPDNNSIRSQSGKSDHAIKTNKGSNGSQLDQALPPGWDDLGIAEKVHHFSSNINKAFSPGEVDKIATGYQSWITTLASDSKKEVKKIYDNKIKELTPNA